MRRSGVGGDGGAACSRSPRLSHGAGNGTWLGSGSGVCSLAGAFLPTGHHPQVAGSVPVRSSTLRVGRAGCPREKNGKKYMYMYIYTYMYLYTYMCVYIYM